MNSNVRIAKQVAGVARFQDAPAAVSECWRARRRKSWSWGRSGLAALMIAVVLTLTVSTQLTHAQTEADPPASEPSEPPLESILIVGKCMGPIDYQVTVVDPPNGRTEASLKKAVQQTLDRINERMSTYIDDSYVSKFNISQSTDFIECDAETALVVQRAIDISKLTKGAFDITVGPAVELWSFGRSEWRPGNSFEPPSESEIKKNLEVVGYQKLSVRLDPPSIKKAIREFKSICQQLPKDTLSIKSGKSWLNLAVEMF